MKKKIRFLSILTLIFLEVGCSTPSSSQSTTSSVEKKEIIHWDNSYSSDDFNQNQIYQENLFYDGKYVTDNIELNKKKDIKYEFYTSSNMRLVNSSDGYAVTFPSTDVQLDYSISKYRVQAKYNNSITTISLENSNPYGQTQTSWNTYYTEWLNRYIANEKYLEDNNLEYTNKVTTKSDLLEGFEVTTYSIKINDSQYIEYPYYDISVVRKPNEFIEFYLFVTKSKENNTEVHENMVASLTEFEHYGTSSIYIKLEDTSRSYWNQDTKLYYEYLKDENTFDFGFFTYSLPDDNKDYLYEYIDKITAEEERLNALTNYKTKIMPTYNHLNYYGDIMEFPNIAANTLALGDKDNDLPVLQFTMQFTTNNNNVNSYNTEANYTPMFDILRGKYDNQLKKLAIDIKNYKKPVLFRLNNEMNSDWTSYCGMLTLLDPDIFKDTWIRLHNIFDEVGVNNCIWIFNPIAITCPYSSWGEDLCYFPGAEYVDALGLTHYEMNNDTLVNEFHTVFQNLYNTKNKNVWDNYPWIISEFGCASGGETSGTLYRNQDKQAKWVENMFYWLSNKQKLNWCKNISAAVWFNCNDYSSNGIVNALYLDDSLTDTFSAFKEGFMLMEEKEDEN